MTPAIRAICRSHFGVYARGRQVVANRCGACPLAAPCGTWQRVPGLTSADLAAGRVRFVEAAEMITGEA